ncbi:hypothetical protein MPLDJ20_310010 [Mesorhizobium plurifarium]|uniref:Uncharacterized protein n=1 Tax=Mesorhizobium plurifarium TaxID=69974 RepID=A0A090FAP0_MESPL|nr:hypothetical protein MPLDJ20_310010 [Mesorhizobium plurifarium]
MVYPATGRAARAKYHFRHSSQASQPGLVTVFGDLGRRGDSRWQSERQGRWRETGQ